MATAAVMRARALAERQHGVITWRQLLDCGYTGKQVEVRIRRGDLTRLHRGVYLFGAARTPFTAVVAACLAVPSALVSHNTAAFLWQLVADPGALVQMTTRSALHMRPGIRLHHSRTLTTSDATKVSGVRVTTVTRTLLDLAATMPFDELERMLSDALARRLTTLAKLRAYVKARSHARGSAVMRGLLSEDPALIRSKAEPRFLALLGRGNVPRPEVNILVQGYEVDFLWRHERLIVEFDGFATHGTRRAFEQDRRRDAALVVAGYRIIRVTWRRLTQESEALLFQLGRALSDRR